MNTLKSLVIASTIAALSACGNSDGPLSQDSQTPPQFINQPQDQTVNAGVPVSFSVTVTPHGGVTYQWRRNGNVIPGANDQSYFLIAAPADNGAKFSVAVTKASTTVVSREAVLTVRTPAAPIEMAVPKSTD